MVVNNESVQRKCRLLDRALLLVCCWWVGLLLVVGGMTLGRDVESEMDEFG